MTKLVLASSSKYRQQLLANLGIDVKICPPAIDESPLPDESPVALTKRLASQKSRKVAHEMPEHIVIGSDQVAVVETPSGRQILGKPGTVEKAVEQLMLCQGKAVYFYTALSICRVDNKNDDKISCVTRVEETCVYFRTHSVAQLRAYVNKEMPLDCAGSFKCEGMGVLLFERITSRDPNTLIGLPIMLLHNMLDRHYGVDLLDLATAMVEETPVIREWNAR